MVFPNGPKEWLAKLVSFDTTCTQSNLAIIYYLRDYLTSIGQKPQIVYSPDKNKAHLLCTLPGVNGSTNGGIILSGHTDVVSVVGQKWDSDPWTLTERDGKLYGRGTADMKGFLAVVLALVPTFLSMKRAKPIHLAFSYDEELGCIGIPVLVDYMKEKKITADACLVGDGRLEVCTGNKGHRVWRCTVKGKAIHSSMALMGTSCNAIEYAAMIITKIREIAKEVRDNDVHDTSYGCPFSPMSTNLIQGGNAVNTVPAECVFEFNIRIADTKVAMNVDARIRQYINEVVVPEMRKEYAEAAVDLDAFCCCPAFNAKEDAPFTKLARKIMKSQKVVKGTGTTEAGFFQEELGIPTVIIGPGTAGAHEANEYTAVADLLRCTEVTQELVSYCTATDKPLESHL
ncbi:glutamamyl carboxypeptidase putativemetallo-peptidase Clan MH Family M18 [Leptomonas pyrrhocoris]|uniref:Glutamamyl carboxypeptidase putativemetallo-peptidase Clan MH Family M18 n=1 Tax=Leptomonas pyrrhocoris TaxID=157538 RepID=A0A0N0DWE8_LEPPY|nr:glutamamyl carboxypeptidase putativemetallo-peptidase Clan MH Family M18 [Leptomonas pyrrhocoris]XP_015660130.1 glutamamyl carboxypeptidase putativemetallo-peptidase Clan MH Family M18 [Leptomonas pyrrhocoris]KPA81690.1 glutamamyl carboxypeptidase putativemetallo-peptidase Clan MH Family M18 [Leptomonas pyrrhocoris]KPA81691.1 glutamamyl carboxypeptidase putativemetallo-peptidase Clan MH Family M18 [Leptomonas pyrrhocoris]|eukprot:XP_015660129.1 glutamamyl carboxypeptidase putativemetallo-peptidase Clan MH Family M18 [Leptomonas pyrrhocoris]